MPKGYKGSYGKSGKKKQTYVKKLTKKSGAKAMKKTAPGA